MRSRKTRWSRGTGTCRAGLGSDAPRVWSTLRGAVRTVPAEDPTSAGIVMCPSIKPHLPSSGCGCERNKRADGAHGALMSA
jgi:hypothetical protein